MREIIILESLFQIFKPNPKSHKMQEWMQGWITNILKRMSCMLKTIIVHSNTMH